MTVKNLVISAALVLGALNAPAAMAQQTSTPIPASAHVHGDIVYGDPNAPVEIIEYGSLTCPHCASFNEEVTSQLKDTLIKEGKVKLVFRNFVRDRMDMAAALAVRCTEDPTQSKRMLNAFFSRQKEWLTAANPPIAITSIALTEGVSTEALSKCQADRAIMQHMIDEMKAGHEKYEIKSIPTIIINGAKVNYKNYTELKEKIELLAAGK